MKLPVWIIQLFCVVFVTVVIGVLIFLGVLCDLWYTEWKLSIIFDAYGIDFERSG